VVKEYDQVQIAKTNFLTELNDVLNDLDYETTSIEAESWLREEIKPDAAFYYDIENKALDTVAINLESGHHFSPKELFNWDKPIESNTRKRKAGGITEEASGTQGVRKMTKISNPGREEGSFT
jgi:hypothetical protein